MQIILFLLIHLFTMPGKDEAYNMLNLGDSYTIGESVTEKERFPEQTLALLKEKNILFNSPQVIAKTGWTTQNLLTSLDTKVPENKYDIVTLLIGVNDQFQGKDTGLYANNFETLLLRSIKLSKGNNKHVFVLSIPDYGVTPFANYASKNPAKISAEIDVFNAINKRISKKYNVSYIDITSISRKAKADTSLLAGDGLHPSGKMYEQWADLLAKEIERQFH